MGVADSLVDADKDLVRLRVCDLVRDFVDVKERDTVDVGVAVREDDSDTEQDSEMLLVSKADELSTAALASARGLVTLTADCETDRLTETEVEHVSVGETLQDPEKVTNTEGVDELESLLEGVSVTVFDVEGVFDWVSDSECEMDGDSLVDPLMESDEPHDSEAETVHDVVSETVAEHDCVTEGD